MRIHHSLIMLLLTTFCVLAAGCGEDTSRRADITLVKIISSNLDLEAWAKVGNTWGVVGTSYDRSGQKQLIYIPKCRDYFLRLQGLKPHNAGAYRSEVERIHIYRIGIPTSTTNEELVSYEYSGLFDGIDLLVLEGCEELSNIDCIGNVDGLKTLDLTGCINLDQQSIENVQQMLPRCEILVDEEYQ